jgi:hypothetical protein
MLELTSQQIAVLERLRERGFAFVAFPLYASHIAVRKGNCAALLAAQNGASLKVYGEPCYLVKGQLSVRVQRGGAEFFVWKKDALEATAERREELERFHAEIEELLLPVE